MATYDQINPEIIGLAEQKALAKSLREHGMKQNLQGQMVSGRFVGASPLQGLADLLNIHTGKSMERELAQKEKDIIQQQQMAQNANLQQGLNQYYGTPEFTQQGPTPEGGNIPVQLAMQPDRRMALATLLAPEGGATSKAIASKLLEKEFETPKTHVVQPGAVLVDEKGNKMYQAPYRPLAGEGGYGSGFAGEGHFNKKSDWITPDGRTTIKAADVSKDRSLVQLAQFLSKGLDRIKDEDIKKSDTILGDVTKENPNKSFFAKKLGFEDAVSAQTKINSSSVMQLLQNLPPGPASDKDIKMAKSTFPGYGSEKALREWIVNTKELLNDKVAIINAKYGSENWYGAQGSSLKSKEKSNYSANNLPPGVTKELWNVMTDEEKAAF
jgi:hypothetical protein